MADRKAVRGFGIGLWVLVPQKIGGKVANPGFGNSACRGTGEGGPE